MAFYSHPPIQLYAYAPMAIPNQAEFYAVYPSGGHPGMVDASAFYYDANPKGVVGQSTGESYNIRNGVLGLRAVLGSHFIALSFPFLSLSSPLLSLTSLLPESGCQLSALLGLAD